MLFPQKIEPLHPKVLVIYSKFKNPLKCQNNIF